MSPLSPLFLWATLVPLAAGIAVDSAERLAAAGDYRDDGVFSSLVLASGLWEQPRLLRVLRAGVCSAAPLRALLVARIALAAMTVIPGLDPRVRGTLLCLVFATSMLMALRSLYGGDGSDQMENILVAGLAVALLLAPSGYAEVGIWFIAAQSLLSYAASGLAKAASPLWRGGTAMRFILATGVYGARWPHAFATRHQALSALACRSVIVLECALAIAIFLPAPALYVLLALGLAMHALIALFMGLNKFLLMWAATYPAIIVCQQALHH